MIKKTLLTLAISCLLSSPLQAADQKPEPEKITISLLDTVPYAFQNEDGLRVGYLFDIATAVAQKLPYKSSILIASPQRIVRDLPRNEFNCIIAANSDFISGNSGFHVDTGLKLEVGILPNKSVSLSSYEDLNGKRIAVVKGTTFNPKFDKDESLIKDLTPNYSSSAKMLHAGRVDAAGGALASLRYSAKISGIDPKDFGEPLVFSTFDVWFSCTQQFAQDHDLTSLQDVLTQLKNEGRLLDIQNEYLN